MSVNSPKVTLGDAVSDAEELFGEEAPTAEQITSEADPEHFDRTFLGKQENFVLRGDVTSPAPFPLQVIPRVAYTINYNFVWDDSEEAWVPQNPFSGGGGVAGTESFKVAANNQTVGDGGEFIDWSFDDFDDHHDSGNNFNLSTNNYEVPADGIYYFSLNCGFSTFPTGNSVACSIRIRGVDLLSINGHQADDQNPKMTCSTVSELSAGDTIAAFIFQNSGSGQALDDENEVTHFEGFRIA